MQDRVEDILKKIHVLLAKGEAYHGSTDRVIISKRDMFNILEELNEAVYQVLDQYEATSRSKEKARLDFEKSQNDIVVRTKRKIGEVNAASLMYTDSMLTDVKDAIEDARDTFEEEMKNILNRLDSLTADVDINKKDVLSKLRELEESERFEKMLEQERLEMDKSEADDDDDEQPDDAPKKADIVVKIHDPGDTGITMFGKKRAPKKTKEEKRQMLEDMKRKDDDAEGDDVPDVGGRHFVAEDFDLDKEYFEFIDGDSDDSSDSEPKKGFFDSLFSKNKK